MNIQLVLSGGVAGIESGPVLEDHHMRPVQTVRHSYDHHLAAVAQGNRPQTNPNDARLNPVSDHVLHLEHVLVRIEAIQPTDCRRRPIGVLDPQDQITTSAVRERTDVGQKLLSFGFRPQTSLALNSRDRRFSNAIGHQGVQMAFLDAVESSWQNARSQRFLRTSTARLWSVLRHRSASTGIPAPRAWMRAQRRLHVAHLERHRACTRLPETDTAPSLPRLRRFQR